MPLPKRKRNIAVMQVLAGTMCAQTEPSRAGAALFPRVQRAGALCAVFLALLLCGCSSFNREWRRAAGKPAPANALEGRWEGRWLSDVNGHTGNLRCLITRVDDAHCRARFRATYRQVLRFSYTVPLAVQPHYDGWEFSGEENLGWLAGGVYYYEGRANATNFFSTYHCKYDHGTFELHRLE